jgi:4-azaleucine resistance transporter AzlC
MISPAAPSVFCAWPGVVVVSDGPIVFTRDGARRGAVAMLPLLPGVVAFGLLYGFLAIQAGLSVLQVGLFSAFVFAGASQFLALELWQEPLPVITLLVGVVVLNLRHVLMGAAIMPWLRPLGGWRAHASLYFMTDESWGMAMAEQQRGGRDAAFMAGAGVTLWVFWVTSSLAGTMAGDVRAVVERFGLAFLTTAFFTVLLAGFWRGRADLLPWGVSAGIAVLAKALLPGTWYIVLGAMAGSLVAALLKRGIHA